MFTIDNSYYTDYKEYDPNYDTWSQSILETSYREGFKDNEKSQITVHVLAPAYPGNEKEFPFLEGHNLRRFQIKRDGSLDNVKFVS